MTTSDPSRDGLDRSNPHRLHPDRRLRAELNRKVFHLATALVPLLVWFLPRGFALFLLSSAVIVAVGVELARRQLRWFRYHFLRRTRRLLRSHERGRFSGATYLALGYLLAFLLFPRAVAVAAMLYGAWGDASAALVGRRWGNHRIRSGKSWEGAAACFAVTLMVGVVIPGIGPVAALFGAAAATMLELLPLPLDDNLRVTLGGGLALWVAASLTITL